MPAASNPLTQTGEPITWNFKLLAQNDLGGFGGMGEGMAVQIAKDGRRIIWLAHESAPKNFTGVDVSDPRNPKVVVQTDAAAGAHALELAGNDRRYPGGRLSDAEDGPEAGRPGAVRRVGAGKAALDFVLRLLGPDLARRASIVVLRRRIRAHGVRARPTSSRATRSTTSSTAASTCAIRPSRSKSAAGGCRAPAPPITSRRRRATRSTRAIARTTPTSIRTGRTGSISATSTAACS